jgi:hypothetical protein
MPPISNSLAPKCGCQQSHIKATIDQVVHSVSTVEAVGKTLELLTAQQGPKNWHYMLICDVGMIAMHAFATHMCLLAQLLAEIKSNLNKSETGHRCEAAANDTDVAHSIGGRPCHYNASACPHHHTTKSTSQSLCRPVATIRQHHHAADCCPPAAACSPKAKRSKPPCAVGPQS